MVTDSREEIGKALGKIPSGVGVLTAKADGSEAAMLASWFQQVAFEPPMISVAVNKSRPILEKIQSSKSFTISLFHTNQKELFAHFARGFEPGQDPFQNVKTVQSGVGGSVLADALSFLSCEVTGELDAGDHKVFLGKVVKGGILNEGHSMTHTRKNGFHY
jgi:flavin reductase (DIM6/NTAB) family NADH-FMN oxidoreductase RutF